MGQCRYRRWKKGSVGNKTSLLGQCRYCAVAVQVFRWQRGHRAIANGAVWVVPFTGQTGNLSGTTGIRGAKPWRTGRSAMVPDIRGAKPWRTGRSAMIAFPVMVWASLCPSRMRSLSHEVSHEVCDGTMPTLPTKYLHCPRRDVLLPTLPFFHRRYLHCPIIFLKKPALPRFGGKYLHCQQRGQKATCAANFP